MRSKFPAAMLVALTLVARRTASTPATPPAGPVANA